METYCSSQTSIFTLPLEFSTRSAPVEGRSARMPSSEARQKEKGKRQKSETNATEHACLILPSALAIFTFTFFLFPFTFDRLRAWLEAVLRLSLPLLCLRPLPGSWGGCDVSAQDKPLRAHRRNLL